VWATVVLAASLLGGCEWVLDLRSFEHPAGDATDGKTSDIRPDNAAGCFGALGICSQPTNVRDFGTLTTIDTDGGCDSIITTTQPELCVLAGTTITISSRVNAHGSRALVLFASASITVAQNGYVDVASHIGATAGAAADDARCATLESGTPSGGGAGGGAGGSFAGVGGHGGGGAGGTVAGAIPGPTVTQPAFLRGGCPGSYGGDGSGGAGAFGHGGGAVYFVAKTAITVDGVVNASGAGGSDSGAMNAGGSAGGSGGMIWFDAPAISVTSSARVAALGGSGASGSFDGGSYAGASGEDPPVQSAPPYAPGGAANPNAGGGGDGSDPLTGHAGAIAGLYGGGGGGGGCGFIVADPAHSTIAGGTTFPPP
jgi:hypothetical protein